MSPLLAPLFAQLVSLQLGDRTEGRYADFNGDRRYEASSAPLVGLEVSSRRTNLRLMYSPLFVITPIEREPRELYVFHQLGATLSYALQRTTLNVGSTFSIGSLNLKLVGLQGLQAPTTTGIPAPGVPAVSVPGAAAGAPTTGAPTTTTPGGPLTRPPEIDQRVKFYVSTNTLGLTHLLSKAVQLTVLGSSSIARGLDDASRRFYPGLRAWSLSANTNYLYALSKQDSFNGNASIIKTWSSNDNEAATLNLTVSWLHQFGPMTTGTVGTGFNITRFSQADGLAGFTVFPTFTVGATHRVPLARGGLSFAFAAYSSPALDPLRALVDPRVGFNGSIVYTRRKLTLSTSGGMAFSVAPAGTKASAVNSGQGEARAAYAVTKLASIDTGARIIRQTYGGVDIIPTSWAAFVGLTLGYVAVLAGGHEGVQ